MEKQHSFLTTPSTKTHSLVIYIDGAARGNPGPAGAGIHIVLDDDKILNKGIYLGKKTNNQAEYLALALALLFAEKMCTEHHIKNPHLAVFSDSELLIKQMRGEYKVKNEILARLKSCIDASLEKFSYKFAHVRREKNTIADSLANLGIDEKHKIPAPFIKHLSDAGLLI